MGALVCPICRGELTAAGPALRCAAGHSYDVARSGYVNLLRPGIKSNARSGDPEDMVKARRAFLSRGYYDRWVREAAAAAGRALGEPPATLVDAACGEGRHTLTLAGALCPALTVGVDASKGAADLAQKAANAARREAAGRAENGAGDCGAGDCRAENGAGNCGRGNGGSGNGAGDLGEARKIGEVRFVAGNIFDMPLADGCADLVTVLFAPIPFDEARRVLRGGGLLAVCSAGREHLVELRRAVYDKVRYKDDEIAVPDGFELAARENVTYSVDLCGEALAELFAMTPFCRRVGQAARERIAASNGSPMTVSVDITVLKKL